MVLMSGSMHLQVSMHLFFVQVIDEYSSKSFRLLAMAVGVIPQAAKLGLVQMTQQQVEGCAVNMQLLCLVVLTNNIRSDSKATISQLQEGYAWLLHIC